MSRSTAMHRDQQDMRLQHFSPSSGSSVVSCRTVPFSPVPVGLRGDKAENTRTPAESLQLPTWNHSSQSRPPEVPPRAPSRHAAQLPVAKRRRGRAGSGLSGHKMASAALAAGGCVRVWGRSRNGGPGAARPRLASQPAATALSGPRLPLSERLV